MSKPESGSEPKHTPGEWRAVVRPVGDCMYSIGWGEDCYGGHAVYSEFIEPLGIQLHGEDYDRTHATAKKGPPPSSADARLIAAAPAMFEALRFAASELDQDSNACAAARAALRKAGHE